MNSINEDKITCSLKSECPIIIDENNEKLKEKLGDNEISIGDIIEREDTDEGVDSNERRNERKESDSEIISTEGAHRVPHRSGVRHHMGRGRGRRAHRNNLLNRSSSLNSGEASLNALNLDSCTK